MRHRTSAADVAAAAADDRGPGLDRRRAAIAVANRRRAERARFRRGLTPGRAAGLLREHELPGWAASWRVSGLVSSIPKVGERRALRIIGGARVMSEVALGTLSAGEREALAAAVERVCADHRPVCPDPHPRGSTLEPTMTSGHGGAQ